MAEVNGEIKIFRNDDAGYEQWLKEAGGYVYNDFGGRKVEYKKLHRSSCRQLHNVKPGQKKTSVPKICSCEGSKLLQYLEQERGSKGIGYSPCSYCHPLESATPPSVPLGEAGKIVKEQLPPAVARRVCIEIRVPGPPPLHQCGVSISSPKHPHRQRVEEVIKRAREAMQGKPLLAGRIAMEIEYAGLGPVTDPVNVVCALPNIFEGLVYHDDNQIREVHCYEKGEYGYTVRFRKLKD